MNEVEAEGCCFANTAECCKSCPWCPCYGVRQSNPAGQIVVPGAKVSLVMVFEGTGSWTFGGGPGNPQCCCYSCSYYPFAAGAVYECVSINSGECGCVHTFQRTDETPIGEPSQSWIDPLPDVIYLKCGWGQIVPGCLDEPAFQFCEECPPGTEHEGQKVKVRWIIGGTLDTSQSQCEIIGKQPPLCSTVCPEIACSPQVGVCGPDPDEPGANYLIAPCQGECDGGEASRDIWVCSKNCATQQACWKKVGTLSATWWVTSYGTTCSPSVEPCQTCART